MTAKVVLNDPIVGREGCGLRFPHPVVDTERVDEHNGIAGPHCLEVQAVRGATARAFRNASCRKYQSGRSACEPPADANQPQSELHHLRFLLRVISETVPHKRYSARRTTDGFTCVARRT